MAYTIKIKNKTIKRIANLEKNIAQKIYLLIDRKYHTEKKLIEIFK
jgi:ribosomal protein S17E